MTVGSPISRHSVFTTKAHHPLYTFLTNCVWRHLCRLANASCPRCLCQPFHILNNQPATYRHEPFGRLLHIHTPDSLPCLAMLGQASVLPKPEGLSLLLTAAVGAAGASPCRALLQPIPTLTLLPTLPLPDSPPPPVAFSLCSFCVSLPRGCVAVSFSTILSFSLLARRSVFLRRRP